MSRGRLKCIQFISQSSTSKAVIIIMHVSLRKVHTWWCDLMPNEAGLHHLHLGEQIIYCLCAYLISGAGLHVFMCVMCTCLSVCEKNDIHSLQGNYIIALIKDQIKNQGAWLEWIRNKICKSEKLNLPMSKTLCFIPCPLISWLVGLFVVSENTQKQLNRFQRNVGEGFVTGQEILDKGENPGLCFVKSWFSSRTSLYCLLFPAGENPPNSMMLPPTCPALTRSWWWLVVIHKRPLFFVSSDQRKLPLMRWVTWSASFRKSPAGSKLLSFHNYWGHCSWEQ